MEYSFNLGISCGEIFISDNQKACTILLYPDKKPPILKRIIYDVDLAINCIGITNIFKVLKREKQIKGFFAFMVHWCEPRLSRKKYWQ